MEPEYCPDCVVELYPIKHKVGTRISWMKCPKCGLKKYPDTGINIEKQGRFIDHIRKMNKNINQFNKDVQ